MSKARNLANFIGIPAINSSADATAITIDSGEKVGVGASSPQEKLHVYTTADARVEIESTTGLAAFKATNNQGSYAWYVDSSADKFHLYDFTDSANRVTLDGAGNVGIGTTSPDSGPRLHLSKGSAGTVDSHANSVLTIEDDSTAILQFLTPANEGIQLRFGDPDSNGVGLIEYGHGTDNLNFHTASSERMRIDGSGNVGIGTTSPSAKLHIDTSGIALYATGKCGIGISSPLTALHAESTGNESLRSVRVSYNSSYYGEMVQRGAGGTMFRQYGGANFKWNSGGTDYMALLTNNLHVLGSVNQNSSSASDERLKNNVQTITGALDKVKALRGVTYTWNKGERKDQTDYGVIAQEVEKVIPEVVYDTILPLLDGDEETVYKTVDYSRLSSVLINAIKELEAKVTALEAK